MTATGTITLKVTLQQLNALHVILQNMVTHPEAAEQVYATYLQDRSLVKSLAVLVQEQIIEQQTVSQPEGDGHA